MRVKFYLISFLFFMIPTYLPAQWTDTIYYDINEKIAQVQDCEFYDVIEYTGDRLIVKAYYKNGVEKFTKNYITQGANIKPNKVEKYIKKGKLTKDGVFSNYNSSGKKVREAKYSNGELMYGPLFFHESGDTLYEYADVMPEFPGNVDGFRRFISDNLKYPVLAKQNRIQGKVFVSFVVGKRGEVKYISILRGIDPILDKEAIRVIGLSPKWKPGKHNDKCVNVLYIMPIIFKL